MEHYFTFTRLLGLNDNLGSNLPLFKEARVSRYQSVNKMVDLIQTALATRPDLPLQATMLDPTDPQWDDVMPFPVIDRSRYGGYAGGICGLLLFYSYNYNLFSTNLRFRTFRNAFPLLITFFFVDAYSTYRKQILKINLFDEYCWLRAQELVKQNEYMLEHEDVKKVVWWQEDLQETLGKIYRQANDHKSSDFKDSELILQDFINRYVDPDTASPMKNHVHLQ